MKQAKRDRAIGFFLSACLHLLALLLLSLISLQLDRGNGTSLILFEAVDSALNLQQLPIFELEQTSVEAVAPQVGPSLKMDVQFAVAPSELRPSTLATEIAVAAAIAADIRPALDNPSPPSQANMRAVAAIQDRVGHAGGKTGEARFALAWTNINDVDLHVIAPSGERISHEHRRSQCKGVLDVDMNVDGETSEPVENIRWISGAPWGRYTVLANMFQVHRGAPAATSEFELLVELGDHCEIVRDAVSLQDQVAVFRFLYVANSVGQAQRGQLLNELAQQQTREEARAEPLLELAQQAGSSRERDRRLNALIAQYPHTDAAIAAMRLLGGSTTKR